jgi:hypothetical protein
MVSRYGNENAGAKSELFATTGDKLTIMMRDRTQAINGIRGLLESDGMRGQSSHHNVDHFKISILTFMRRSVSQLTIRCNHSAETAVIFELRNKVKMLRRDIADERDAHGMAINSIRGLLESESIRGK